MVRSCIVHTSQNVEESISDAYSEMVLNNSALYMIYCTLVLPYISYCCEIWGNTYKTRVQPLYITQKRDIRICNHLEYRSHTKPAFLKLNTLTIADLVKFKSMVLMYKIYNNLMPSNILSYFCMVHMSHDHATRQAGHFKNRYCRTTLKSVCLSIRGPVMWNKLHSDLKNSTTVNMFKKRYNTFLVSEYEATYFLAKIAISNYYFFCVVIMFYPFLPPLNDQGNATYKYYTSCISLSASCVICAMYDARWCWMNKHHTIPYHTIPYHTTTNALPSKRIYCDAYENNKNMLS